MDSRVDHSKADCLQDAIEVSTIKAGIQVAVSGRGQLLCLANPGGEVDHRNGYNMREQYKNTGKDFDSASLLWGKTDTVNPSQA